MSGAGSPQARWHAPEPPGPSGGTGQLGPRPPGTQSRGGRRAAGQDAAALLLEEVLEEPELPLLAEDDEDVAFSLAPEPPEPLEPESEAVEVLELPAVELLEVDRLSVR